MRILLAMLAVLSSTGALAAGLADPCTAAFAREKYRGFDTFPQTAKDAIGVYRKTWGTYCARRDPKLVGGLYVAMREMGKSLEKAVPKQPEESLPKLVENLPKFVPAIRCFVYDGGSQCEASPEDFAKVAAKGTKDDVLFASTYRDLRGYETMPPWIEQTWDYGGCTRYGEYDWVAKLQAADKAIGRLTNEVYRQELTVWKNTMLDWISGDLTRAGTCSCGDKDAPLKDLARLVEYLTTSPDSAKYLAPVRELRAGLESKKFTLRSQKDAHCSGG